MGRAVGIVCAPHHCPARLSRSSVASGPRVCVLWPYPVGAARTVSQYVVLPCRYVGRIGWSQPSCPSERRDRLQLPHYIGNADQTPRQARPDQGWIPLQLPDGPTHGLQAIACCICGARTGRLGGAHVCATAGRIADSGYLQPLKSPYGAVLLPTVFVIMPQTCGLVRIGGPVAGNR